MKIEDVINWTLTEDQENHVRGHKEQIVKTLEAVPPGDSKMRLLDMGSYLQMAPVCHYQLGYGEVMACIKGRGRRSAVIHSRDGQEFRCAVDNFDAEKDQFPYENEFFDTVLCSEVLPFMQVDPMWMLYEINRITKMDGTLVLTSANPNSIKAVWKVMNGFHPGTFPHYVISGDPRLSREYAAHELKELVHAAGFALVQLFGCNYAEPFNETDIKLMEFLKANWVPDLPREECLVAVARKSFKPQDRYPKWLYY